MKNFVKLNEFNAKTFGAWLENAQDASYEERYALAQALKANSRALFGDYFYFGEDGAILTQNTPDRYFDILGKQVALSLEEGRPMEFALRALTENERKNGVGFSIQVTSTTQYFEEANQEKQKRCCGDVIILGCKCSREK